MEHASDAHFSCLKALQDNASTEEELSPGKEVEASGEPEALAVCLVAMPEACLEPPAAVPLDVELLVEPEGPLAEALEAPAAGAFRGLSVVSL